MLSYRSGGRLLDSVVPGGAVAVPIQGHIFEGPGEDRNSCFVQMDMVVEACEVPGPAREAYVLKNRSYSNGQFMKNLSCSERKVQIQRNRSCSEETFMLKNC